MSCAAQRMMVLTGNLLPSSIRSMDAANKSARKYPSYTLAQLEQFVAEGGGNEIMAQEIAARKAGLSKTFSVPQILGGKAQVKVGRL